MHYHSTEFGNTFLRISNEKGSFPIQLTDDDGVAMPDATIGKQLREGCEYFLAQK